VHYRKAGMDRAGIPVFEVTGISLPRVNQDQFRRGKEVPRNDLRPGDLVFFISLSQRVIDHVGLYLGDTEFIHASPSKGVVVSSLRQDYYEKRFQGAKRIIP
jgi:murein DD-endopeptidase / murein LD-carboxypeptidase